MTRNHRIRFAENNLAAGDAAVLTVSSALAGFPATNLTDSYRFRTWKPAGNFTIDATNNKIYINDGTDRTITLTSASYTYSTLASHIQTQLNASSSAWTCTYSTTTFLFTIGRSAGTAILRFTQTSGAAWDMLGYTPVIDTSSGTGLAANEVRNHTSEWIHLDLGVATEITFVSLLGLLGEVYSISDTATVTLMGNSSDSFTAPALTVTLTPDTHGLYKFTDDETNTTYRYWKLNIVDRLNINGPTAFEFGYFYLGDYTTIESRNVSSGFSKSQVDTTQAETSESGAMYFQTGFKYMKFESVEIGYMEASDRRALEQIFYDLGKYTPFFVSFDPTLLVSEETSELTRYVVFDDEPKFTHVKTDVYSVRMSFREVM
jgi:hypothetical protein